MTHPVRVWRPNRGPENEFSKPWVAECQIHPDFYGRFGSEVEAVAAVDAHARATRQDTQ